MGQPSAFNDLDDEENGQVIQSVIDIKKFLMFLTGLQISNCQTTCSIVNGKMVKLHVEQPGALSIQIFLTELSV